MYYTRTQNKNEKHQIKWIKTLLSNYFKVPNETKIHLTAYQIHRQNKLIFIDLAQHENKMIFHFQIVKASIFNSITERW